MEVDVFETGKGLQSNGSSDVSRSPDDLLAEANLSLATDPLRTESLAHDALIQVPGYPPALLLLGAARRVQGDAAGARATLDPLVEIWPRSLELRLELGLALSALGEHQIAVAVLSQALNLDRGFSRAWKALGEELHLLGDRLGAEAALAHHFIESTADPRLRQAVVAIREGRQQHAEEMLLDFLEHQPEDLDALKLLAELAFRSHRHDDAAALLEQCLALSPDFAEARCSYAAALMELNRTHQAIVEIEQLLKLEPRKLRYRALMAGALETIGRLEEALALYEEMIEDFPAHPTSWLGCGNVLSSLGRKEQSIAAFRKAIELFPFLGGAYWSLATVKSFRFTDAEVTSMETHLAHSEMSDDDRMYLRFALGLVYETRKDYARSFEHYSAGNALQREDGSYDGRMMKSHRARCEAMFTKEFFVQRSGAGCDLKGPIFILGLPRSGSTLIEQMLSNHSAIEGGGELAAMQWIVRRILDDFFASHAAYPDVVADLEPEELGSLGLEYLENTRPYRLLGRPYFTDKAPNNHMHIGLISIILPGAKIVDARRHPLACGFSNFRLRFSKGQNFTYDLKDFGEFYCNYVAMMAGFEKVLPGRIHRVIYEQMVADPEKELRRLLDYLGLPFEEQCLRFYENSRFVRTASSDQVKMPIFGDSVEHWRNYEQWLDPLKQALGSVLDAYPGVPKLGEPIQDCLETTG